MTSPLRVALCCFYCGHRRIEDRPLELIAGDTLRRHDTPCAICGDPIDALAGDPGRWLVDLPTPSAPGVMKGHHLLCVTKRVYPR